MPRRLACALSLFAAFALPALAGCGGASHAPATTATVARTTTPAPPPDPHAPLTLEAAEQILRSHGFGGVVRSEHPFRPREPFKVVVGIRPEAADVPGYKAFFFYGNRFVGTDTPDVSAEVFVVRQRGDEITLAYPLYRPPDALPVPTAGRGRVTFRWNGTRVVPLDPIPSSVWGAAISRR
jgi:LppP/LprE lipoprotein